jgi:hypothetical protein
MSEDDIVDSRIVSAPDVLKRSSYAYSVETAIPHAEAGIVGVAVCKTADSSVQQKPQPYCLIAVACQVGGAHEIAVCRFCKAAHLCYF